MLFSVSKTTLSVLVFIYFPAVHVFFFTANFYLSTKISCHYFSPIPSPPYYLVFSPFLLVCC